MEVVYLNEDKSKWSVFKDGKKEECFFVSRDGVPNLKTIEFYSSSGDSVALNFKINGKMKSFLFDCRVADLPLETVLGHSLRLSNVDETLPVVFDSPALKKECMRLNIHDSHDYLDGLLTFLDKIFE